MAFALEWDQAGQRLYQTGDKNMVLYVFNSTDEYLEYWIHEADYWRDLCHADD